MNEVLRLQVSRHGLESMQTRVLESPLGEPCDVVPLPFAAAALQGLARAMEDQLCSSPADLGPEERAALQEAGLLSDGQWLAPATFYRLAGQRLFAALFPSSDLPDHNVRGALDAALAHAEGGIACQLRFDSDAVDLASLPWEILCDPAGQHLVADGRLRLTRYISFGQPMAPLPISDRLEVLLVVSRPTDTPTLDPDVERDVIQRSFQQLQASHRVHVEVLTPPTLPALAAALSARPYHAIHFDGHGVLRGSCPQCGRELAEDQPVCDNRRCPGFGRAPRGVEGCLLFENGQADRRAELVDAHQLATTLATRQVRLFVASACQSATVGGPSVLTSVGPRLILAGVPAVVAMQSAVPVQTTADFAAGFYAALARGESIAAATNAGRRALFGRDLWYVPVTYLRTRDGEGFLFRQSTWVYLRPTGASPLDLQRLRPRDAAPYPFLSAFEITDAAVYCGREGDVQRLLSEVLHRAHAVLYGPPGVGKTSLVNAGLGPELLRHGHLVLTVREYAMGDPVTQLRRAIAASPALDVDASRCRDLQELLSLLFQAADRPVAVVFDEFDDFLRQATAGQRGAFIAQFTACIRAFDPLRCCLLLVVRDDCLGLLRDFQEAAPEIFHALVPLGLLTLDQAREAIQQPLAQHLPPMRIDPSFLEHTLLPELAAVQGEQAINPTYLQVVCHELYQAARQAGTDTVDASLYPPGGTRALLKRYLEQSLAALALEQRDLARQLLKQMVSPAGERAYQSAEHLASLVEAEPGQVQEVLDALLKAGLLETRAGLHSTATYSLGHPLLAAEVQRWFDREEALNRCAQDTLDRAWADWYARQRGPEQAHELLVGPNRLQELAARRRWLAIEAPQLCLLLHSAVRWRYQTHYWTQQLKEDAGARRLLQDMQGETPGPAGEEAVLAAEALGLERDYVGQQGLARAAVQHGDGVVRHTAALALAAVGLDAIDEARETLGSARPAGRPWRAVQALAQMKAAGLAIPALPPGQSAGVDLWSIGIRLFDSRWRLLAETLGGGLGGGLALLLMMMVVWLPVRFSGLFIAPYALADAAMYLPVGFLLGSLCAGTRSVWDTIKPSRASRVLGGTLGMLLGMVVLMPLVPETAWYQFGRYLLAALIAGYGIALGWALVPAGARHRLRAAAVGGALGGALGLALCEALGLALPFRLGPEAAVFFWAEGSWTSALASGLAVATGAALGLGIALGAELGQTLWRRLQVEPPDDELAAAEQPAQGPAIG